MTKHIHVGSGTKAARAAKDAAGDARDAWAAARIAEGAAGAAQDAAGDARAAWAAARIAERAAQSAKA